MGDATHLCVSPCAYVIILCALKHVLFIEGAQNGGLHPSSDGTQAQDTSRASSTAGSDGVFQGNPLERTSEQDVSRRQNSLLDHDVTVPGSNNPPPPEVPTVLDGDGRTADVRNQPPSDEVSAASIDAASGSSLKMEHAAVKNSQRSEAFTEAGSGSSIEKEHAVEKTPQPSEGRGRGTKVKDTSTETETHKETVGVADKASVEGPSKRGGAAGAKKLPRPKESKKVSKNPALLVKREKPGVFSVHLSEDRSLISLLENVMVKHEDGALRFDESQMPPLALGPNYVKFDFENFSRAHVYLYAIIFHMKRRGYIKKISTAMSHNPASEEIQLLNHQFWPQVKIQDDTLEISYSQLPDIVLLVSGWGTSRKYPDVYILPKDVMLVTWDESTEPTQATRKKQAAERVNKKPVGTPMSKPTKTVTDAETAKQISDAPRTTSEYPRKTFWRHTKNDYPSSKDPFYSSFQASEGSEKSSTYTEDKRASINESSSNPSQPRSHTSSTYTEYRRAFVNKPISKFSQPSSHTSPTAGPRKDWSWPPLKEYKSDFFSSGSPHEKLSSDPKSPNASCSSDHPCKPRTPDHSSSSIPRRPLPLRPKGNASARRSGACVLAVVPILATIFFRF